MKKVIIIFLCLSAFISVNAQLIKSIGTRPGISTSRIDSAMTKQKVDLRKIVGKDLKITLASIDKNSNNFAIGTAGIYTINFDVLNSGGEDINITNVVVQTYLITSSGYNSQVGGYVLKAGVPNFPASGILHPGEKFRGSYLHSGFTPADNIGNKFSIKIDNSNVIAETNENNNTIEIPVTGNLESWSTPLPDLTFQVSSIKPVTGSSYLNTSMEIYVVNIGAGEIPVDVVNQIIPLLQVYPAGSPGTNLYNEAFPFATRVNNNQTYPGYYRVNGPLKPGDKVRIGGSSHINGLTSGANIIFHLTIGTFNNVQLPETNTINNTVDYVYTVN